MLGGLEEDEDDGTQVSSNVSQRRRGRAVEYELDEDEDEDENDEDGYEHEDSLPHHHSPQRRLDPTAHSRNHEEELLFQRHQSAHSQLPRRLQPVPSRYAHEYDPEIVRQDRPARRGARDGGTRRRENGSEDAPPRYEDHVFDRVVDGDDDDDDDA